MSEELFELRQAIEAGDTTQALALLDEMDEMSRDDKINKVLSFMEMLLKHRIKQAAEKRSTRSWEKSVKHAVGRIARTNKRRKAGGYYLEDDALALALAEAYPSALEDAADEAFEGIYTDEQIAAMVDRDTLLDAALADIIETQREDS